MEPFTTDASARYAFARSRELGAGENDVLDFDDHRTWGPRLTAGLGGLLTDGVRDKPLKAGAEGRQTPNGSPVTSGGERARGPAAPAGQFPGGSGR